MRSALYAGERKGPSVGERRLRPLSLKKGKSLPNQTRKEKKSWLRRRSTKKKERPPLFSYQKETSVPEREKRNLGTFAFRGKISSSAKETIVALYTSSRSDQREGVACSTVWHPPGKEVRMLWGGKKKSNANEEELSGDEHISGGVKGCYKRRGDSITLGGKKRGWRPSSRGERRVHPQRGKDPPDEKKTMSPVTKGTGEYSAGPERSP